MATVKDVLCKKFISAEVSDSLSSVLGKMKSSGETSVLVFDKSKYIGLLSKSWLVNTKIDLSMKVSNVVKHRSRAKSSFFVPLLNESDSLKEVCRLMVACDSHTLPVGKSSAISGVVHAHDILDKIKDSYNSISIEKIKSRKGLIVFNESDNLGKIIALMSRSKTEHCPVVDDNGYLCGFVSIVDVLWKFTILPNKGLRMSHGRKYNKIGRSGIDQGDKPDLSDLTVGNFMNECVSCNSSSSVAEVIAQMLDKNLSSIVLCDGKKPVGIVSVKDIFEDYSKPMRQKL
jgi:CBS domain-containing protein